jgi:hypothetical protein
MFIFREGVGTPSAIKTLSTIGMALSQSERLKYMLEEQTKYISRAKVRDSSELTGIRKAQASGTYFGMAPAAGSKFSLSVPGTVEQNGLAMNVTYRGRGTNMDYSSVLEKTQFTAVEGDALRSPVYNKAVLTTPAYDRRKEPFSQQDLSGAYINGVFTGPYTAPCRVPGFIQYFPPKRFNGKYCNFNTNVLPS